MHRQGISAAKCKLLKNKRKILDQDESSLDGLISILNTAEERINKLEERLTKTIQLKHKGKKGRKKLTYLQ